MRLAVEHRTTYRYDPPAEALSLRLRLFAVATAQQQVRRWRVTVNGETVEPWLTTAFGEPEALWFARRQGGEVTVLAEGEVETADAAGVLGPERRVRPSVFLRATALTRPGDRVRELAEAATGENPLARLHALNELVHEAIAYRQGVSAIETTAEETAALGAGVCQDFAHVFVAAARAMEIPARYVVGYLHDAAAPVTETHAWAEAHVEGLGWVGFDPVHRLCPADAHVRLCSGFDAPDAAPIRGTFVQGSEEEMDVSVKIADGMNQSQSQSGDGQSQSQGSGDSGRTQQ